MKKTLLVGLAIGLVSVAATAVFAGPSPVRPMPNQGGFTGQKNFGGKGIVGSSHDLSNVGQASASQAAAQIAGYSGGVASDRQSRICVYCHHPHNAYSADANLNGTNAPTAAEFTYSPLWNRQMSTRTFVNYNNGDMMTTNSTPGTDKRHVLNAGNAALSGVSLLCMSCHDGVVAMNAYSKDTGSSEGQGSNTKLGAIASTAAFTSDMNNHHPMGFKYQDVVNADKEIAKVDAIMVPKNLVVGNERLSSAQITNGVQIGDLLYGGTTTADATFQCVTCHDVHNTANAPNAERFLWRSNNESNFCLVCHLK